MSRRTASRADTRLKSKFALFTLIGLVLSPLAVANASPPFDHEQWRREHPRPAGKALAALNKGEPRTVRMIYFLPNDRPYRAEVVQKMKDEILHIQNFYAEQMQAQDQGNRTFRIETDAQGQPRVHRVDGRHPNSHYLQHDTADDVLEEIDPIFDIEANVYLIVVDSKDFLLANGREVGGVGGRSRKMGGFAFADGNVWFDVAAHELGHAFGLNHDFRDDTYIMSYEPLNSDQARLSDCNAEFLAVHPYLNPNISTEREWDQYIKTVEPTDDYPVGSTSVSIRLEVGSPKGLHQALLFSTTKEPHFAAGFLEVQACRGLAGKEKTLVGFEYDGKIPSSPSSRLSGSPVHVVMTQVVDKEGDDFSKNLVFAPKSPHRVAYLRQEHSVQSVSFSPDGTLLAISGGNGPSVWKWRTDKAPTLVRGKSRRDASPMLFSPNGRFLAIGGYTVELWDATATQLVDTFEYEYDAQSKWSEVMQFSSDGDLLAIGTKENIQLWDVAAKRHVAAINVDDPWVNAVSFSRDGSLLAFENGDEVVLWDVATKRRVDALKHRDKGWVQAVSFSPTATLLGVSRGKNVDLWDVARRRQITSFEHQGWVGAVSFSPDGNLVAAAGFTGASVWDVSSRRRAAIFYGEYGNSMSFSPDGTLLAVGSADATVRLWDVSEWTQSSGQVITIGEEEETTDDEEAIPQTLTKVSGNGQSGQAGEPLAKPFVVSVLDQNGAAFAGAVVSFSVTAGGGTLSSTTATTNANGRARSTLTLGPDPGPNTVTATVEGLGTVTFTATATAQTAHSLTKVSGDNQAGPASTQLTEPLVVSVLDQDGEAFAGASVTFSVTAGGGMLSSTTASNSCAVGSSTSSTTITTDANGQAAIRLTLGSESGTNMVKATVEGLEPTTFTATAAEQAMPHRLTKVCGDDQEGTVGAPLTAPLVISVSDEDGAAIAGVIVSFAVTAGGGTLSSATATTDANGRAATNLTLGSEVGPNMVSATVEGLASVTFTATGQEDPLLSLFDLFGSGKLAALPDRTQLLQNAPNPFNSQTVLSYFLLAPGPVRLEVFALSGQRVAVLHQGPQQAGYHRLHWDGRDAAGYPVASGAYLYRLVTDEAVLTRKLILLR